MKRYQKNVKHAALAAMVALALSSTGVFAADLPAGGKVISGNVTVTEGTNYAAGTENTAEVLINPVDNPSSMAFYIKGYGFIEWNSFDIASGKSLSFSGDNGSFIVNRVTGNSKSGIYGTLNVQNIPFILANPNGIIVGGSAHISGNDIMLAAMDVAYSNNSTQFTFTNPGPITLGSAEIKGKVSALGKTIAVADGITFSGDSALRLLAGGSSIAIAAGNDVQSMGSGGTITFNGSLTDSAYAVALTADASTVSMVDGKTISLTNADSSVTINTASLQNANITAPRMTVINSSDLTITGGKLSGDEVKALSGTLADSGDLTSSGTVTVSGTEITGSSLTLAGKNVVVGSGATIGTGDKETVRMLAGNSIEGDVVSTSLSSNVPDNNITVSGSVSGKNILLAGGAVNVNGGTIDAGTNSVYLLAGKKINVANALAESGDVITEAVTGNKVNISSGANIQAKEVHAAGYETALQGSSQVSATEPINAVTGSAIQKDNGILERKQAAGVTRGILSRDNTVTVSDGSAFVELPTKGEVAQGSVIYKVGDSTTTYLDGGSTLLNPVNSSTISVEQKDSLNHSIINWQTFDIGIGGTLFFDTQYGALLNRVTGSYESWLKGKLNHTGAYPLLLVNPNGIHVYEGATINASNLLLSGLEMTDTAFENFMVPGAAVFNTSSTGAVKIDAGVSFANNEDDKLILVGKTIDVAQNTISANTLSVNATETATLTNLTYNGSLKGNDVFDSNGGSLTISGGTYNGAVDLKGSTVNMSVASHTGDMKALGTNVTLSGGSHSDGDINLQGNSVTMTGVTFNDATKDVTLAGLGDNGSVNVTNSTITAADVAFSGKNVFVSQWGNTPAAWSANTFTLGKGESASNSSNINNVNLTITKEDGTPEIGTDIALTLNNAEISAPKIAINPDSLTLTGGKLTATTGNVDIHAIGKATVQGQSAIKSEAGDISVQADGNATVKGNSSINARDNINIQAADISVGISGDTANNIESTNGSISLRTVAEDAIASAASTSVINVQKANLTATAADKSIGLVGYNVTSSGTISSKTVNFTATNTVSNSGEIMATTLNSNSKDFVTSGDIDVNTMNVTVNETNGNITVNGKVDVGTDLTLTGGSQGTVALNGSVNAPSVKVASKTITGNGGEVVTDGSILLASGNKDGEGKYTTTEGGKIDLTSMTLKADKLTAFAESTTINNSIINANTMEAAAANTVNTSTWEATFGDNENIHNLVMSGNTVGNKAANGAIDTVKMAGRNVTFGGGSSDAKAFKANSVAVTSGNAITVSSGQVDITGADGISLRGKSVTVDGTVNAKKIALNATETDVDLRAYSALNATAVTDSIGISAHNNIKAYGDIFVKDAENEKIGSIKLTAPNVEIGYSSYWRTFEAGELNVSASESIKVEQATVGVKSNIDLSSKKVVVSKSAITTVGTLNIEGTEDSENPAVAISAGSELTGTGVTIAGKGLNVSNSRLIATSGGITATSTGANDIVMDASDFGAADETAGIVNISSGKAVQLLGGSIVAGKNVTVTANEALSDSDRRAINTTGNLTAGNDISLNATAGEVSSSGNLTANSGNITLDSADGSKISTTGNLTAASGTIALGHAEETGTVDVEIGSGSVNAAELHINATDKITVQGTTVNVTGEGLNLTSGDVDLNSSTVTVKGDVVVSSGDTDIDGSAITSTDGNININNGTETGAIDVTGAGALQTAKGNIAIGNDGSGAVTLNNALDAKNINVKGHSIITSGRAFNATDGNITLIAKSAAGENDHKAINVSNAMTASGNISITTTAGEVSSSGNLTANSGNITLDSADGSKISTTGNLTAESGTIALGHADGTGTVEIGSSSGSREVNAARLHINATEKIGVQRTNLNVTDSEEGISLNSNVVEVGSSTLNATAGGIRVVATDADIASSTLTAAGSVGVSSSSDTDITGSTITSTGGSININNTAEAGAIDIIDASAMRALNGDISIGNSNSGAVNLVTSPVWANDLTALKGKNITVKGQSINAIGLGFDATTGEIKLTAKSAGVENGSKAINNAVDMTAGTNISINTAAGEVSSSGNLKANNGNINIDSTDGSKITVAGKMSAENGNIVLGHADGEEEKKTKNIELKSNGIGAGAYAQSVNVNAADNIYISNYNINTIGEDGFDLSSKGLTIHASTIDADKGNLRITFQTMADGIDSSLIGNNNLSGVWLYALDTSEGNGRISVTSTNDIATNDATLSAAHDINFKAAENVDIKGTYGNIKSTSGKVDIQAQTGNIEVNGTANADKIEMTAGTGENSGNITLDKTSNVSSSSEVKLSANGGVINTLGNINVQSGNPSIKSGVISLKANTVNIGGVDDKTADNRMLSAGRLTVEAPNAINVEKAAVDVTENLTLSSKKVNIEKSKIISNSGELAIAGTDNGVSVDKSTIQGTSVLLSGKGIKVDQDVEIDVNSSTITATGTDVALNSTADIDVFQATITAHDGVSLVSASENKVENSRFTAANKGISVTSTGEDNDINLTDSTLEAKNATDGNIVIASAKDVEVARSSMTAGKEISFNKANGSSGTINLTGTIKAESRSEAKDGTVIFGNTSTQKLYIGTDEKPAILTAGSTVYHGTEEMKVENAHIEVAGEDGISLSSKEVNVINSSLTAANGNIDVMAAKNRVTASGYMNAINITVDSADGSEITAEGSMIAEGGKITLGHIASDDKPVATAKVFIGGEYGSRTIGEIPATSTIKAGNLVIHATDNINMKNVDVIVNGEEGLALTSKDIRAKGINLNVTGKANLTSETVGIDDTDLTAGDDVNIKGSWTAAGTPVSITDTNITSTGGDVSLQARKIAVSTTGTDAKTIQGKNLLLAAANSYDETTRSYGMDSANTVTVNNTNLIGEKLTLIGYGVNVTGDANTGVTTNNLIGAVSTERVTLDESGNVYSFVKPATESATNPKLSISGKVVSFTPGTPININLYGDAVFHNTGNSALEAMSFRADSPYSLDIQGELTVTDTQGISLASKSIRIADNLKATNSSIKLSSTGGEMYIAGNLSAKDDIMVKSTQNIVLGETDKSVSVTSNNGKVSLLAGTFADDNGALGAWTGGTGAGSTAVNNNIGITNATISAKGDVDIKGGSIAVAGTSSVTSNTGEVTLAAANSIDAERYNVSDSNDVTIGGTLSLGKTHIYGDDVNFAAGSSTTIGTGVEADVNAVNAKVTNATITGSKSFNATNNVSMEGAKLTGTTDIKGSAVSITNSSNLDGTNTIEGSTITVTDSTLKGISNLQGEGSTISVTNSSLEGTVALNGQSVSLQGENKISGSVSMTGENATVTGSLVKKSGATAASLNVTADVINVGNETAGVASTIDQLTATAADGTANVRLSDAEAVPAKTDVTVVGKDVTIGNSKFKSLDAKGTNSLTLGSEALTATGAIALQDKNLTLAGKSLTANTISLTADETAAISSAILSSSENSIAGKNVTMSETNTISGATKITATEDVSISGSDNVTGKLEITAKKTSLKNASLTATRGADITGTSVSFENVTLGNDVDISAGQTLLTGNVSLAEGKTISTDEHMLVRSAELAEGVALAAKNLEVVSSTLGNNNKLKASEDISVTGESVNIGATDVAVTLEAGRNLSISATPAGEDEEAHAVTVINSTLKSGLTDTTGKTSLAGDVVNIAGDNSLAGVVEAESPTVNISGINTLQGKLVSEGSIEVSGAELVSGDGSFAIEGNEINLSGTNTVKGTVDITVADTATILGTVNKAEGTAANLSLHGDKVIVGNNEEGSEVTDIKVDKLAISNVNSATLQNAKVTADTFTVSDVQNAGLHNAEITAVTSITDTAKATLSDLTMQADISVNAGETAVAGRINAAEHNVELKGNKVTLKDAEVTAGTASVTAGEDAVLNGVSLATSNDNVTVTAPKAVLKGTVNAETITIDAANVQIGDGTVDTAVTANAVNGADGAVQTLAINKADVKNANLTTKAAENIILTGAIDAEGKDLVLDAPNVQIGNGVADTAIKANSLSGVADNESTEALEGIRNLTLNKANVEEIGTLSTEATENILLKGRIEAGNKDLELKSPAVQIGDGTPGTSIEANTLTVQADEVGMNKGTVKASSAVLQGKKVILENNSSIEADKEEGTISLLAADTDNTVTVSVSRLDEEGNTVLDEDGNPVTDITSVRTITFQPDNAVVVDASRLEGADISLQGYTVAVQNGSAIYADKSLTALAGKEMKSVDGGMPEVTAKAEGEDEAPNTVIQQNSVIVVSGRNWRNFQPVPISYGGSVEPEEPVEPEVPVGPEVLPDNPVPVTESLPVEPVSSPGLVVDVAGGYLWGKDYSLFISWYAGQSDASRYRSLGTYFDEKFGLSGYLLQGRDAFSLPVKGREGFGLSLQSEDAFPMALTGRFFDMKQVNAEKEEKDEQ